MAYKLFRNEDFSMQIRQVLASAVGQMAAIRE